MSDKLRGWAREIDLEQFEKRFRARYILKKRVNAVLCLFIVFCGVTALLYSVFVNHMNLFDRLRYMTFNGTIFTTIVSLIFAAVCLVEAGAETEVTLRIVYFLRLSAAVTEMVIVVVVMIGLTPMFPDQPDITSYTGIMMHLVIPPATLFSFVFNDAPIGKLKPWEPFYGTWFVTIYAVVMSTLIVTGTLPEEKVPYSILDFEHTDPLSGLLVLTGIYAVGYVMALILSSLNRKYSWIWFYDFKRLRSRR